MHISLDIYLQNEFHKNYGFHDYFRLSSVLRKLLLDNASFYEIVLVARDYHKNCRNKPDNSLTSLIFSDLDKLNLLIKRSTSKCSWSGGCILYIKKINLNNMIYVKIVCDNKYLKYVAFSKNIPIVINITQKYQINTILDSKENQIDYLKRDDFIITVPKPLDNFYIVYLNSNSEQPNTVKEITDESASNSENRLKGDANESSPSLLNNVKEIIDKNSSNCEDQLKGNTNESSPLLTNTNKKSVFSRIFNFSSPPKKLHIN